MSLDPSDETPAPPKERRFKLSRACDRCRRRRIKCDEGHPCQSCLSSHSACTFEESGKRTQHSKSKRTASLEDRMHHLETLIQSIPKNIFEAGTRGASDPSKPRTSATFSHSNILGFNGSTTYPSGVPPPPLSVSSLTNPSTHFSPSSMPVSFNSVLGPSASDLLSETTVSRPSLSQSYMYFDEQGCKRWQGETSGLPLLDVLFDRASAPFPGEWQKSMAPSSPVSAAESASEQEDNPSVATGEWFPDRVARRIDVNPEALWKVLTSCISPDLMDALVQCYLSTSYYLMPFLHVPTFLKDYENPVKWGEPGFTSFILAICCLSSRHIDDPRVKSEGTDPCSAGLSWFELYSRLRTLPAADQPTLYTVQSVLVAAVYAIGLGKLSKGFALLSEAITLSFDAGLHHSVEAYDCFDSIEYEIRIRTFWCVYIWDKQAGAAFGRPPLLRLRDCDVPEPAVVDDEFITIEGVGQQPEGTSSRMEAFVATLRYYVVLESVLNLPPSLNASASPFLARASKLLSGFRRITDMHEEEIILGELRRNLPQHWAHTPETIASDDAIRITQTVGLHCLERFIMLLIHRHRFSNFVAQRTLRDGDAEPTLEEMHTLKACYACAHEIVAANLHTATKGLMAYYGVHVIHQLTQAGRTLVAIVLSAKTEDLRSLVAPSLEALCSCVSLLRRFSRRYVCGLRNADLLEEFCRLSQIPLDAPAAGNEFPRSRPPWLRPVKKRHRTPPTPRSTTSSDSQDAHDFLDIPRATIASHSGPSHSHSSHEDAFLSVTGDVDIDMQYHSMSHISSAIRTPEMTPEMFHSDMSSGGISPTDLVTLLNESSFDVETLFTPSGTTDMFPNEPLSSIHGSGRDLDIIASP